MSTIEVTSNQPTKPAAPVEKTELANLDEVNESKQSASDLNESDENNSEDSETTENDSEESQEKGDSDVQKPKKKGGFQKRIDKLNSKISLASQEAEYWREKYLKAGNKDEPAAKVDDKPSTDASGKPNPDKFDTMGEYLEALSDWKVEQKIKQANEKSSAQKAQESYQAKVSEFRTKVNELAKVHEDFVDLVDEVDSKIQMSPAVHDLLLESPVGDKLMYELVKNPKEYERINSLSPLMAAKEIGLIEHRLSKDSESKKVETKKTSKAPEPINPVGSKSAAAVGKTIFDPNLSQAEFEALEKQRLKAKRSW